MCSRGIERVALGVAGENGLGVWVACVLMGLGVRTILGFLYFITQDLLTIRNVYCISW